MPSRYQYITIIKNDDKKRYYVPNYYPIIPPANEDIYLITVEGDRYDLLANKYYGNASLWWIIPASNNLDCDSLYPPSGIQIRIPVDKEKVLLEYSNINK